MNSVEKIIVGGLGKVLSRKMLRRNDNTLSILIYHRVLKKADYLRPNEPTTEVFDWQMELVSRYFSPIGMHEALARLDAGELPENAVCVTFDDGYSDNESSALPILQRWRIPATVFVSTGFLDGKRMWNDSIIESIRLYKGDSLDLGSVGLKQFDVSSMEKRMLVVDKLLSMIKHRPVSARNEVVSYIQSLVKGLPTGLMMTSSQLRSLCRQGIEIGAHTVNHPILSSITESEARIEIDQSKQKLESIIDRNVRYFAYPNGRYGQDYTDRDCEIVKALGFSAALSTDAGVSGIHTDRYNLPRFTPWDKSVIRFYMRMVTNNRLVC